MVLYSEAANFRQGEGWLDYGAFMSIMKLNGLSDAEQLELVKKANVVEGLLLQKRQEQVTKQQEEIKRAGNKPRGGSPGIIGARDRDRRN